MSDDEMIPGDTSEPPGTIAPEDEYARRLAAVEAIRAAGGDPYPVRFDRDRTAASLHEEYGALEPGTETGVTVRVAGRLLLIRRQGKLVFATLRDGTAAIQLFVSQAEVGEEALAEFARLDLGDWIGVEGEVMTTRRGELSVKVRTFALLAKSLRPLPDKWHGLSDVDTRFRRRYVDLIVNEEARRVFQVRFAGTTTVPCPDGSVEGRPLDLAPPWPRRTLRELIAEHAGVDVHPSMPVGELQKVCDTLGVPYDPKWGPGKLVLEIYEKTTEHAIVGPMFVLDYPREVSPLARPHRDDPALVERFEVIV